MILNSILRRNFATKLMGGVTKNKKDSAGRRLGMKKYHGEVVKTSQIMVRQRGFKWEPGFNVAVGRDHTINAACDGYVHHEYDPYKKKTVISVVPAALQDKKANYNVQVWHPELFPEKAQNNPQTIPPPKETDSRKTLVQKKNLGKLIKKATLA